MIRLDDLAPWPDGDASQAAHDRYRLLAAVARRLDIVDRRPSRRQWQRATIPVDALGKFRGAVETEGTRNYRRRIEVGAGYRFQSVRYHRDRTLQRVLDAIDSYAEEVG